MSRLAFVVAVSRNGIIGRNRRLPWRVSSDLKRFKAITMGKPVIMGRKTWESLPVRPLPGRPNIVITRQRDFSAPGASIAASAAEALNEAERHDPPEIAVIGGGEIFAMFAGRADRIYLTEVDLVAAGDTQFPKLDPGEWREIAREHIARGPNDDAACLIRTLERTKPE
jgi:dihydrofolate reductase